MKKEELNKLASGQQIQNKRNNLVFLVEEVNTVTKKATVLNVETKEEKEVAYTTMIRNYELLGEQVDEKQTEEKPAKEKVEVKEEKAVKAKPAKQVRKPAAKEKTEEKPKAVPQSSSQIHEMVQKLEAGLKERFKNAQRHVTGQYVAYRQKHNFVEIYEGKRALYVMFRTKRLSDEQKEQVDHIYPAKHGWPQDGKLIIREEADLEKAFEFIELSYVDSEGLSNADSGKESSEKKEDAKD